jgi:pyruvate,orthophosphate dikinase
MRPVDGVEVPNDHSDGAYDASVLARLRSDVHEDVTPIVERAAGMVSRLGRYGLRLETALDRLSDGDERYVAHPMLDSYHTVWFELHEELIRLAGRDRRSETEAGRA